MQKIIFSLLLLSQIFIGWSQQTSTIKGKIVDSKSEKPLLNVMVSIENANLTTLTDINGDFTIENAIKGSQFLKITSSGYIQQIISIEVAYGKVTEIGSIFFEENQLEL